MNDMNGLRGCLSGSIVKLGISARDIIYNTGFYGHPREDCLELTLVESAYLLYKKRITIKQDEKYLDFNDLICEASRMTDNFEVKYIVYKDLRERGYIIKQSVTDFRVYPRGGRPGSTPSEFLVHTLSERWPIHLSDLIQQIETAANMRKDLVMAVVDEESDITFYSARLRSMKGKMKEKLLCSDIRAMLLEDRVIVWDKDALAKLHNEFFYGKPLDEFHLHLSLIEAAYLQEIEIIDIIDISEKEAKKILTSCEFARYAVTVEPDFPIKLAVYKELRNSGMIVKTGYKFGSHYRVYMNVDKQKGMKHSEFLVHAVESDHIFNLSQLSRAVRLAHSVKKQMVFAWMAGNGINYLQISRMKM
jgi:tRNA-intron endonuclease